MIKISRLPIVNQIQDDKTIDTFKRVFTFKHYKTLYILIMLITNIPVSKTQMLKQTLPQK